MSLKHTYPTQFWMIVLVAWTIMLIGFIMILKLKQPEQRCPEEKVEQSQPLPSQGSIEAVYGVNELTPQEIACVTVTCYNPVAAQTNSEYWITASGAKIDTLNPLKHRWVAISRDLETKGINLHDTIILTGVGRYNGQWIVKDRMNKRWTDKIDLLVGTNNYISKWTQVQITSR